eukprot:9070251-Ditylum_brightwellii.AAC.1
MRRTLSLDWRAWGEQKMDRLRRMCLCLATVQTNQTQKVFYHLQRRQLTDPQRKAMHLQTWK